MLRVEYYVLSSGNRWTIKYDGKEYPYETQAEALDAAVLAAHASGKNGFNAQVLLQGDNGQWRTEWTYGRDPYPPAG